MFIYLIIYYAETLLNVIFFFLGTHLLILRKQRRGVVIFVHTWSHQHSEKLGNWCSRLYSRNSNMTLIIIHIHQSRIISVWGRKEKKNGGWVGGGELVWSGRRSAKYHRKKVFALLQNARVHTGAISLFCTTAGWRPWLSVYYRKDWSNFKWQLSTIHPVMTLMTIFIRVVLWTHFAFPCI